MLSANLPELRYVQPPFPLHKRPEVCEGIFARLDDNLSREIARQEAEPPSERSDLIISFLRWCLATLDPDAYAEIQDRFIGKARMKVPQNPVKFLNLPYYARHKINQLHRVNIHKMPPSRVLDIGCGPGHAHLIGRHFGHKVFGIDIPLPEDHIYNGLCNFFAAEKLDHRVEAMQRLPQLPGGRFDLVTILILNLGPWSDAEWRFLVEDLKENHLADGGTIYLSFTSKRWTPEAWGYISKIAEWTHADRVALIR